MTDTRSMMGQRMVVTGGSGHIGVNLVRSLIADGHRVTVVDVVYHLASVISVIGRMGGLVESVNVDGARSAASAALAAGVPRLVHCSSVHAFDLARHRGEPVVAGHRLSMRQLGEFAAACADRARPPWTAPAWAADACAPVATWVARHTRSPLLPTREALGALAAFPVVDDSKARRALAHQPRPVQETLTDLYRHFVAAGRVDWSARTPGLAGSRGGPLVASMAE